MLNRVLDLVDLADLQKLIADEESEGKTIEYKSENYRLKSPDAADKKAQHQELLKDVSAFANSLGGDLVIGMKAVAGKPTAVVGFEETNVDALKLQITQIIQAGVEPRIGFAIHSVPLTANKVVFVVRVLRSNVSPHRVVYQREPGQFFGRNSAGVFSMDTSELRQAFVQSSTTYDQIKAFRTSRVEKIRAGDTPALLSKASKLILHFIPLDSFTSRLSFTPTELFNQHGNLSMLHYTGGWGARFNIDGVVTLDNAYGPGPSTGYVQAFRNGILETVADDVIFFMPHDQQKQSPFFKTDYVKQMLERVPLYLRCFQGLGIPTPVWCLVTLIGVQGVSIYSTNHIRQGFPIDRDTLYLPEIEINDFSTPIVEILRPVFDVIWNAAGFEGCFMFDKENQRRGSW